MDSLKKRYASALLSIAKDEDKNDQYRDDAKALSHGLKENSRLIEIFNSDFVDKSEKLAIVDNILSSCKEANFKNFIKVIIDNHRQKQMIAILDEFVSLSNSASNIEEGFAYSTIPLDDKQLAELEESLGKKLNTKVYLINRIDEDLIGGIKVVIKDFIFDGSIKHKIESLKSDLLERNVE